MKKFQIICGRYIGGGSKAGYIYFVYVNSVKSVKVVPKSHQLPILFILAASLILNTKICT